MLEEIAMPLPPRHPLGHVSDPFGVMSPDPYTDPSGLHDELEKQVGGIDRQLVGRAAGRRDGFDREQRRFLTESDAPDREEATPRGGALESVALELGDFGGGFDPELDNVL